MATVTVTVEKIGIEDLNLGTGSWNRTSSTGGTQAMTKIDLANLLPEITALAAELNILSGVTATAANLNRTKSYPKFGTVTLTTDGAQTPITGVGFTPRLILFLSGYSGSLAVGLDNGTTHYSIVWIPSLSGCVTTASYSIYGYTSASNYISALVSAVGSDGFTLTATEVGTATAVVYYVCFP